MVTKEYIFVNNSNTGESKDFESGRYNVIQEDHMNIGERLKELRRELGLSQEEFGSKLKVHGKQLARYEIGKAVPAVKVLTKIADFCEVSLDYLVYGQDKRLAKRAQINDEELLEFLRRVDRLKKPKRERLKWALQGLLDKEEKV